MNITFEIIKEDKTVTPVTFYDITAIGPGSEIGTSTIYSNGMQFTCTLPMGELWNKLKKIKDESGS